MKANVCDLTIGTTFIYKGDLYKVVNKDEYPFVECKWLDGPHRYDLNILFGGQQEIVEVIKGGVQKYKFIKSGHTMIRKVAYIEII